MNGSYLCQLSSGQHDDWIKLYELAFPADERTPVEDLQRLLSKGHLLLHRTVDENEELLCFSIVNVMSDFGLLAYIATDTTKRSTGVGSKHMTRLIETLQERYAHFTALFLEIESTKELDLHIDVQTMRERRLMFYQRLGAKRLRQFYGMPSYSNRGAKSPGELLWFELNESCVQESELPRVIQEIFQKGYGLDSDNLHVQSIISQWSSDTALPVACVVPEPPLKAPSAKKEEPVATVQEPVTSLSFTQKIRSKLRTFWLSFRLLKLKMLVRRRVTLR